MLLVLFGTPGSGKSYIGQILAEEFGFYHYEADIDLTPEIKETILQHEPISEAMREAYFGAVCEKIRMLKQIHKNLVVTQTFTKEKNRKRILCRFNETIFIWVKTNPSIIEKRILERTGHIVKEFYAAFISARFDPPQIPHLVLHNNNGREEIRIQLRSIFNNLQQYGSMEVKLAF
jgi:gluconate kinase